MEGFCNKIENRTVYPILIKNNGKSYFTLYYYTKHADSVLHNDEKRILYFDSPSEMEAFCEENNLVIENDIVEYDFDSPIENPIGYRSLLENWNLLNTIATTLSMFFEGDCSKYNSLYDLLFRLYNPDLALPATYKLCERDYKKLQKVFKKKNRILDRFYLRL